MTGGGADAASGAPRSSPASSSSALVETAGTDESTALGDESALEGASSCCRRIHFSVRFLSTSSERIARSCAMRRTSNCRRNAICRRRNRSRSTCSTSRESSMHSRRLFRNARCIRFKILRSPRRDPHPVSRWRPGRRLFPRAMRQTAADACQQRVLPPAVARASRPPMTQFLATPCHDTCNTRQTIKPVRTCCQPAPSYTRTKQLCRVSSKKTVYFRHTEIAT
jgi:hypothetical protein